MADRASAVPGQHRAARTALAVAVAVAAFVYGLPQYASAGDVWHAVGHVGWGTGTVLGLVAAWNLVTYWLVWVATVPGLRIRQAALVTAAPTAVANTVPAGSYLAIALSYAMLRSFGQQRSAATLAMLVTGLGNNIAKLAVPVVALVAVALDGELDAGRIMTAGLGVAVLVVISVALVALLREDDTAERLGRAAARVASPVSRVLRRPPPTGWDATVRRFRASASERLAARWHWITLTTLNSHLALFAVLLASLRATGVGAEDVAASEVLAVFAFARLVTAVPLTPGGVGVVELALTAGLVAAGGGRPAVVAGVLVYRALTYLVQIPFGGLAYVVWRRTVVGDGVPQPGEEWHHRAPRPIVGGPAGKVQRPARSCRATQPGGDDP